MSNERTLAGQILSKAKDHVIRDRGLQHGDVEPSFTMIAELWSTWINHAVAHRTGMGILPPVHLQPEDVLQMMSMLKKSRSLYGDATLSDHYEDDVGYTSLAGMINDAGENKSIKNTSVAPPPDIPDFLKKKQEEEILRNLNSNSSDESQTDAEQQ